LRANALDELPAAARKLSPGEPAIPTIMEASSS